MARRVLTVTLIVLLNVFIGCNGIDSGKGQLVPPMSGSRLNLLRQPNLTRLERAISSSKWPVIARLTVTVLNRW